MNNISLETSVHWLSGNIVFLRSKLGFTRNLQKNITVISRRNYASLHASGKLDVSLLAPCACIADRIEIRHSSSIDFVLAINVQT